MPAAIERKTGPGQVEEIGQARLLFNYDIDSDELKPEHKQFLMNEVIPRARRSPRGLVVVADGTADRLGDARHNEDLSRRRALKLQSFLRQQLPNYAWQFSTKWQGERKAEKEGDIDGSVNDRFRGVLLTVLEPGQPIPPRPTIPKVPTPPKEFPKKPNEVPRVIPPPKVQDPCLNHRDVPTSRDFSIQIFAGVTGGEVLEGANIHFIIRDNTHRLQTRYQLLAVGAGTPSPLPIAPMAAGKPKSFSTSKSVKVTNFGPKAIFLSATSPPIVPGFSQTQVGVTGLLLEFRPESTGFFNNPLNSVAISLDSGVIPSLPGGHLSGGVMIPLSICTGDIGAVRF
jgi:hypothetical protein